MTFAFHRLRQLLSLTLRLRFVNWVSFQRKMDSIQIVLLGFCAFANVHAHVACNPGASATVTAVALALANVALQLLWLLSLLLHLVSFFVVWLLLLFFLCIFGCLLVCIVRVVYIASFFFLSRNNQYTNGVVFFGYRNRLISPVASPLPQRPLLHWSVLATSYYIFVLVILCTFRRSVFATCSFQVLR